jgi:nucleoside-diphosphate-sugar epimerase
MSSAPPGSDTVHDAAPCLVTGATGFIGTALVRRLRAAGRPVRALARSRKHIAADADVTVVDLTSGTIPSGTLDGIETVYHLAAKTHDLFAADAADPDYWRVNLEGTQRLLESLLSRSIKRVVFVSSVKAQAEETTGEIDETQPPDPTTAYGRSKLAAERLVLSEAARRGFEAVCLRFPLVYGPGQRGNLVRMIAAIDRGRFPPPPSAGNRRSMLHVENAVEALMLAGQHPAAAGQTYTVTDAAPYSTRELYDCIRDGLGKRPVQWAVPAWAFRRLASAGDAARAILGRRVGFDSEALQKLFGSAWFSSDKIARELGYRPTRALRDAMPELIAEYRAEVGKRA